MECGILESEEEYNEYLKNVDLSKYDIKLVDFFRNGYLIIDNQKYNMDNLYIECGSMNNEKYIMLIDYNEPDIDILTGIRKNNFIRSNYMFFKRSMCFAEIYVMFKENILNNTLNIDTLKKDTIKKIIYSFDNRQHKLVPELQFNEYYERKHKQ
jgi:hypothetical protein